MLDNDQEHGPAQPGLCRRLRAIFSRADWTQVLQRRISRWAREVFGEVAATDPKERVLRILEEAAELAQAEGLPRSQAHMILDYVFDRPAGEAPQELAGVYLTLMAYAEAKGLSLNVEARKELERVLNPRVAARCRAKAAEKARRHLSTPPAGE